MDKEMERIFKEWVEDNTDDLEIRKHLFEQKHIYFSWLVTFLSKTIKKQKKA